MFESEKVKACRRSVRPGGFSIIELLIALLIMSTIMIGVIPLFHRSMVANLSSAGTTELINWGQTAVEDVSQQAFNSELLTLDGGRERVVTEYYDEASHSWRPTPVPVGTAAMMRTLRVRQFGISAIDDGIIEEDEALSWDVDPRAVHIKQVVVELEGRKKHIRLPHQTLNVTLMKSN